MLDAIKIHFLYKELLFRGHKDITYLKIQNVFKGKFIGNLTVQERQGIKKLACDIAKALTNLEI